MITNLLMSHESILKHTLIRQPNMRLFDLMALVRNIFAQLTVEYYKFGKQFKNDGGY